MESKPKKFKIGLIVGKFYPIHAGHQHLIQTGIDNCERLIVAVCELSDHSIRGEKRAEWIRELFPTAEVQVRNYDGVDENSHEVWANLAIEWAGGKPDVVFTSEAYGEGWAKAIGCEHVLVDIERIKFPVSGTKVRENALAMWEYLSEPVRAHFVKRVCILGAESTGTTTLSKQLAEYYKTVWVPEYGRLYSEARMFDQSGEEGSFVGWRSDEFVHIAKMQNEMEDWLARKANKILICDTDSFATGVWHKRYMGSYSKEVERVAKEKEHDLYIVTDVDIPFVQDGIRDGKKIRKWMHEEFIRELKKWGKKYVIVSGSREERLKKAVEEIEKII